MIYADYKKNIKSILPKVRGKMVEDADMSKLAWFGVGGVTDFLFYPKDKEDIASFYQNLRGIPIMTLGGCSNVLIRDGGLLGCVIRLGTDFSEIRIEDNKIYCGAGAKNAFVAKAAMDNGIGGFEFLYDIPGTIGGSLRMNAGSQGREMKDLVKSVGVFDNGGNYFELSCDEMMFSYRTSKTPSDWLFVDAVLEGYEERPVDIKAKMDEYRQKRKEVQPIGVMTAGCAFKNPSGGLSAWKLIDSAGCRGMKIGGAIVSEKHCNFIINTGDATAEDIENLGEAIREKVMQIHGMELEWEIRLIGVKKR